jgi:hypothetical protein
MRFPCKILGVAFLLALTVPGLSQGINFGSSTGSLVATQPTLTVTESLSSWDLAFTGMGKSQFVVVYVGATEAPMTVDMSPYGSLNLDVSDLLFPFVVGPTTATGSLEVIIDRPKTLPESIEFTEVALQGVSVDPKVFSGLVELKDLPRSNVVKITVVSVTKFE